MENVEFVGFILLFGMLGAWGLFSIIYGENKRIFFSRDFCYRNVGLPLVSNVEFCANNILL
jgi:hypothetical protein